MENPQRARAGESRAFFRECAIVCECLPEAEPKSFFFGFLRWVGQNV